VEFGAFHFLSFHFLLFRWFLGSRRNSRFGRGSRLDGRFGSLLGNRLATIDFFTRFNVLLFFLLLFRNLGNNTFHGRSTFGTFFTDSLGGSSHRCGFRFRGRDAQFSQ